MAQEKIPPCPHCGQSDQVIKVNRIYIESISSSPISDDNVIPRVLRWPGNKNPASFRTMEEKQFLLHFKPPASRPSVTKSVHPDQIIIIFSLFSVFLLYKIYQTQPGYLLASILILAGFYAAYFVGRKKIVGKYQVQKDKELNEKKSIENAIGRWMKLYYCIRDDGVFESHQDRLIPLNELETYLMDKN